MIKLLYVLIFSISLNASYEAGRLIFDRKCSACHTEFISTKKLIYNFKNNNEILHLKAPSFNRVVYKMLHGRKSIINTKDLKREKKEKIRIYIEDYLSYTRFAISVSGMSSRKLYPKKKTMKGKVSIKEYGHLVDYIYDYEKHFKPIIKKKKVKINEESILKRAKQLNKKIIIQAVTKKCNSCKFMKKRVLSNIIVKKVLKKSYIFKTVYMDKEKLPFNISSKVNVIVPSYLILDSKGNIIHVLQKSVKKKDFLKFLRKYK